MSKAAVNGINLHYEEDGKGPPLVLISGYATDISAWDSIRQELSKDFHLILIDNRGAGRSYTPDIPYSAEIMAKDIEALLSLLHLENVYILAHSMGTAIAQTLAIQYPKLVKKIVLANPLICFRPAPSAAFRFFLQMREDGASLATITEGAMPWLFSGQFLKNSDKVKSILHIAATYPYAQSLIGQKRQLEALLDFNSESWFKKITAPLLVIEGEEDLTCPGDAARMHSEIPGSSHLLFSGQGHMAHVEMPNEFTNEVKNFFNLTKK